MGFIKRLIHLKTEDKHTQDLWLMAKHQSSDLMFRHQIGRMVLPRNAATSYHFDSENVDKPGIWVYPKNEIGGGFFCLHVPAETLGIIELDSLTPKGPKGTFGAFHFVMGVPQIIQVIGSF